MMQKHFYRFIILLLFLLASCSIAFIFLLPQYIHTSLLPSLLKNTGIHHFQATRPLLGPNSADIAFLVGRPEEPVIRVASLRIHYFLPDLFRRHIEEISISGVEIHCALENNTLTVNDPDIRKLLLQAQSEKRGATKNISLPFSLKRLSIDQATLLLSVNDQLFRFPFTAHFLFSENSTAPLSLAEIKMSLYLRDQKIEAQAMIDENQEKVRLTLSAENFDLQRFADFPGYPQGLKINANPSLRAHADIKVSPFLLTEFAGTINLGNNGIRLGKLMLKPGEGIPGEKPPFAVSFQGLQKDQNLQLQASSSVPDLQAEYSGKTMHILSPSFQVTGTFKEGNSTLDATARLGLNMQDETYKASVDTVTMETRITGTTGEKLQLEGRLNISDASFSHPLSGIHFEKAAITLPVKFPLTGDVLRGGLTIPEIRLQKKNIGSASGGIEYDREKFQVTTNFTSDLFPGLTASSTLDSSLTINKERETRINLIVPAWNVSDLSLRQFSPALRLETFFSGNISARANFTLGDKQQGQAEISLSDGTLKIPEKKITVSGMETQVGFPKLPLLSSSPAQTFHFTSALFKDLNVKDGMVTYTIESPESFLVEETDFDWAEGSIHTNALRLKKDASLPRIILYCNKLKLTSILSQIGIEQVSGDGTVNGRIPVTVTDGKVTFSDSFLYSTPGVGGAIKIRAADFLTAAIPSNAPQFSQLDFAQEALRDFSYSWAKLQLITQGEDLILGLQLDGKPGQPLPFTYDGKTGSFLRITEKTAPGMSQPIRLDVNFRFPLNTFLDYDKSMKELLQYVQ